MSDTPISQLVHAFRLLILSTVFGFAAHPAAAQPSAEGASTAQVRQAVAPIALQDMITRLDEGQRQADLAAQLLAAPNPDERMRVALRVIAEPVHMKLRTTTGITLRAIPVMRLESLRRHWQFDAYRLGRWQLEAKANFAPYEEMALELAQRRAAWVATRAVGSMDGMPPVLSNRVGALLAQFDASEAALGSILARQFELRQEARMIGMRIQAGRDNVAAAIDDVDRTLFEIDAAPLWHGIGPSREPGAALEAMHGGLEIEKQFAIDYQTFSTGNQQALRIVQVLLLPLILWLSLSSRRRKLPLPGVAARVLRRPFSAWLLLSMLSVLVLEWDAPLLVHEFALLLALVPVFRLLPAGVLRSLGIWPYGAIVLYGLDRLATVAVADSGLYRMLLLLLNVSALALTFHLMRRRPRPVSTAGDSTWQPFVRPLGMTVLVLLLVALVCNIVGNVSLAETIASGVIDSGYMAILLYSSVMVGQGVWLALLSRPSLSRSGFVKKRGAMLQVAWTRLLILGAVLGWLLYSMSRLRLLQPMQDAGAALMRIGFVAGEVSIQLGDVLVFAVSTWLAFWIARAVRGFLREELPSHTILPRGARNSIASLSYYCVLLIGLLIALSAAGFKVSQLAFVFGALGVGIGFGLQNVVNNFVSGLVLMFERPIQPGDIVDAAGTSGTVREIGLRATTIRTFDGADTVVPNGLLLSASLTNWTMFDHSRRFEVLVGVAYGSDPAQVMSILARAAKDTPGVAAEPAPAIWMTGYGDSSLDFVIKAWSAESVSWLDVRSDLLARVLAQLDAGAIAIPFNQVDVNLRSVKNTSPV